MVASDPDWFARAVSGIALLVSVVSLAWSRLDKRRERRAAEAAGLPVVSAYWNPHADGEGWHPMKLAFGDIKRGIRIDRVRVLQPSGSLIAQYDGNGRIKIAEGPIMETRWSFQVAPNIPNASVVMAYIKPPRQTGRDVKLKMEGRFLDGTMKSFAFSVVAAHA